MALFFDPTPSCARKKLGTGDIVRDGDLSTTVIRFEDSNGLS
jgi:hypothetical protein